MIMIALFGELVCAEGFQLRKNRDSLPRKEVDMVFYTPLLLPSHGLPIKYRQLKKHFTFTTYLDLYKYVQNFQGDRASLQKIVFVDYCQDPKVFRLPKEKMICIKWEAIKIPPIWYEPYSKVLTFDDDLVDGKKFIKFYYPGLRPMLRKIPSFEDKKLCTMFVTNWIPERIKILEFFETKPIGTFEFYGTVPEGPHWIDHRMYKGRVPGFYSGKEKLETTKQYKFCVCFENLHTTPGYICEKIFDVFASGTIPIYWGPDNVEKYIPKRCFIDYRDFKNNEDLYRYITSMSKKRYCWYLKNIKKFLSSKRAHLFSVEYFEKLLYKVVRESAVPGK
jgi:hypothetical protein